MIESRLTLHERRLNTKLEANNYSPMTSLVKDLSDGVKLIQLMVRSQFSNPYSFSDRCSQEIMGLSFMCIFVICSY